MKDVTHCGQPMVAVEDPFIYDGTCWYECLNCGGWSHRFAKDDRRRAKVQAKLEPIRHREIGRENFE